MTSPYQKDFEELRQYTKDFRELNNRAEKTFECDLFHEMPEFIFALDIDVVDQKVQEKTPEKPKPKLKLFSPPAPKKIKSTFDLGELSFSPKGNKSLHSNGPLVIQYSRSDLETVDVLFLAHSFDKKDTEDLFEGAQGNLVQKMIRAMSIKEEKFAYGNLYLDEEVQNNFNFFDILDENIVKLIYSEIYRAKPKMVVCFGSIISNILLGKRERISKIRGQVSQKTIHHKEGQHAFSFIPVFHPEFLTINPNMKRLAWEDLQKVMKLLEA